MQYRGLGMIVGLFGIISFGTPMFLEVETPAFASSSKKCTERKIKIPKSYSKFEKLVKNWMSNCVLSRTVNPETGVPWHREEGLVRNNESLRQVWDRISHLKKQRVPIYAERIWMDLSNNTPGVKEIRFFVLSMKDGLPPRPREDSITFDDEEGDTITPFEVKKAAKRIRKILDRWESKESPTGTHMFENRGIRCVLEGLEKHGENIDDAYIELNLLRMGMNPQDPVDRGITKDFPENKVEVREKFTSTFRFWLNYYENEMLSGELSEDGTIRLLKSTDGKIRKVIAILGTQNTDGTGATNRGMREIMKFIARGQRNRESVYYCYSE